MKRKQLIALLVLVLIVGGAGLAVYQHASSTWEEKAAPAGKVLGDFALNDVTRVVIRNGDATVTLVKNHDTWMVHERDDYPADFERVGNFIQGLWQLKPVQEINVGPSQLARLDLVIPAKGVANAATLVELENKDSKHMASLLIGKKYFKKSPQLPDAEGFPAGRYVMLAGATPPKVSLVSDPLEQADSAPTAWLDKTFLQIDRIQSVAIASGTAQWKLVRPTDSSNDWKLADLKFEEEMAPGKVPALTSILGAPRFTDVLAADMKRDGFDSTATVETFDGFTYTLKFGKPDGDNQPMAIAVTANLPKERIPGKEEKTEDKQRLDGEFAATTKRLTETLAKAKTLEARVYLVPKTTFESLWKPRDGLLAEKRDPHLPPLPTPSPTPNPAPTPAATPSASASPQ